MPCSPREQPITLHHTPCAPFSRQIYSCYLNDTGLSLNKLQASQSLPTPSPSVSAGSSWKDITRNCSSSRSDSGQIPRLLVMAVTCKSREESRVPKIKNASCNCWPDHAVLA